MNRHTLHPLIFALYLMNQVALTQDGTTGTVSGIVMAIQSSQRLPLATVMIEGTRWGATANERGEYTIVSVPVGRYTVVTRLLGYQESKIENVEVEEGNTIKINFEMYEVPIPFGEIQVTAERLKRQEDVRPSVISVAPRQAKVLPGVAEDVLRTLQALPGVVAPSDFTSQLIVRGGGPDQNLILIDDIEIFNPYRLYGMISMFNPETVSDISLISAGFPARYGDRLSAVLDVTNKEGDKAVPLKGSVNVNLTNANAVFSGRTPLGIDGSYVIAARRTYYDLVLGPIAKSKGLVSGDVAFPHFWDLQSKFVFEPFSNNRFLINGIMSKEGVGIISGPDREFPDSLSVRDDSRNEALGIAWHYLPTGSFYSKLGLSWYRNRGVSGFGGDVLDPALNREQFGGSDTSGIRLYNLEVDAGYEFRKVSLKEELAWVNNSHTVEAGAGIDFLKTSLIYHFRADELLRSILQSRGVPLIDDFVQTKTYNRFNAFIQDRIKVSDQLSIQPGLRLDHYAIVNRTYLEPRLNISYAIDPITTFRAAWGLYYQSPGYEKLLDQSVFLDLTNSAVGKLNAERGHHLVFGVERWIDNQWQIRAETYIKKLDNLIVREYVPGTVYEVSPVQGQDIHRRSGWTNPAPTAGDSLTPNPINAAKGKTYGLEIFLEKRNTSSESRFSGWISYSLAYANRTNSNGITTPYRFDQRHTVNIVLDYKWNSWLNAGIRWHYGSNFPYTPPAGIKPRVVSITRNGQTEHTIQTDYAGNIIFDIDRGNNNYAITGQLPAYHRLDVRLTAMADYWGLDWDFYLDIINVYNHKNILGYQYFIANDLTLRRNETAMLPIVPTLGVAVRF